MQQLNLQEIETAVNQYGEIVVIKKDNNVLVMSMKEYNKNILKKEIISVLRKSEKEIEEGKGIDCDKAFEELRQKYGY